MAFDFKKEHKEFYMPGTRPEIVTIPPANYVAVKGAGDPNEEGGAYQRAVSVLYAISYTIKMSYKGERRIDGFFEYVVPPLEGFWRQEGRRSGIDYASKGGFLWISVIRLPDFVQKEDFEWAVQQAQSKKKLDCSTAEFLTVDEGLCVQMMHCGSYDEEPATVARMEEFAAAGGYEPDFSLVRQHHEIYLSDPRRTHASKLKTVIRHPIRPQAL